MSSWRYASPQEIFVKFLGVLFVVLLMLFSYGCQNWQADRCEARGGQVASGFMEPFKGCVEAQR